MKLTQTDIERFWAKVDKTETCWNWTASRRGTNNNYGQIAIKRKPYLAHRIAYLLTHGEFPPDGLVIDHKCRNPLCVNPDHLEAVPQAINIARGELPDIRKAVTHCKNGHEFTEENIRIHQGHRVCRACDRKTSLDRYYKIKNGVQASV